MREKNESTVPRSERFLIEIKSRQHGTWQGNITLIGEGKAVPFRSALELLRLIDAAGEEAAEA